MLFADKSTSSRARRSTSFEQTEPSQPLSAVLEAGTWRRSTSQLMASQFLALCSTLVSTFSTTPKSSSSAVMVHTSTYQRWSLISRPVYGTTFSTLLRTTLACSEEPSEAPFSLRPSWQHSRWTRFVSFLYHRGIHS